VTTKTSAERSMMERKNAFIMALRAAMTNRELQQVECVRETDKKPNDTCLLENVCFLEL